MLLAPARARAIAVGALATFLGAALLACSLEWPADAPAGATVRLSTGFVSADLAPGVTLDHVRLRITGPGSSTLLADTTVSIPAGSQSLPIALNVQLTTAEEVLTVSIDLIGNGTIFYHGTTTITAHAGQTSSPSQPVSVIYVGPGANAARVVVLPADTTILANGTLAFRATVYDGSSNVLSGVPLSWSLGANALGSITPGGSFSGIGRRGSVHVVATTPGGVSGFTQLLLAPVATHLTIVSGNDQTGPGGSPLAQPVVVEADGVDGPVPGVVVQFSAGISGGFASPASAVTDTTGRVSVDLTLAPVTGAQTFTASATGAGSVTIDATATAVLGAIKTVSGNGQSATVGTVLSAPFVVQVLNSLGQPVPGQTVTFSTNAFSATVNPTSAVTDSVGEASTSMTLGTLPGVQDFTASIGQLNTSVAETALPVVPASILIVSGNNQSGNGCTTLPNPLVIQTLDANGNPAVGVAITWTYQYGPTPYWGQVHTTTDALGESQLTLTLGDSVLATGAPYPESISAWADVNPEILTVYFTENVTSASGSCSIDKGRSGPALSVKRPGGR